MQQCSYYPSPVSLYFHTNISIHSSAVSVNRFTGESDLLSPVITLGVFTAIMQSVHNSCNSNICLFTVTINHGEQENIVFVTTNKFAAENLHNFSAECRLVPGHLFYSVSQYNQFPFSVAEYTDIIHVTV